MPYTLNGIGTMHYGRKNLFTAHSRCEACGAYGELRSYDTRHWFTIVFVPIIPLGSRRVFGHCPACDRFYMMPLRKWREAKKNSVRELERVSAGAVTDTDSAVAAIGSAASFQSPELIDEHAPWSTPRFPGRGWCLGGDPKPS